METYIVRIYRKPGTSPNGILGKVENVDRQEEKGFTSIGELCRILRLNEEAGGGNFHTMNNGN